VEINP
jgi:hypothetical protein